jgi:two-component system nitrogen regulation response regulator GlnG/two-component system response regulator HydG
MTNSDPVPRPAEPDGTTVSEDEEQGEPVEDFGPAPPKGMALVLAWSKDQPWRIGETLFLPEEFEQTVWLGRGSNTAGEPPKATFLQQRPGQWVPSSAITARAISRYQMALRHVGAAYVAHNEGRCPLLRNGVEATECALAAGDLLQLGKQLVLLCCQRPAELPGDHGCYPSFPFGQPDAYGLVGESPAIWQLRRQIRFVAARPDHVLITGRSGSGKELVAHAIHALSSRGGHAMVSRNAATLPETLIDAELFGNAKNYPNPGMAERPGLIGEARGSTLFLDEVGELAHTAQAHLLRVLDHGEHQRLGEAHARVSDFRLIAATNREVSALKPELLARFTFRIAVPDLNARKEDVPLLMRHFLRRMAERGDAAALGLFAAGDPRGEPRIPLWWASRFLRHRYQTNVRELEALLWVAMGAPEGPPTAPLVEATPAERIRQCLDENNGSIEHTWRALGLSSRFSLLRLIKRYGLEVRRRPSRARGSAGHTQ